MHNKFFSQTYSPEFSFLNNLSTWTFQSKCLFICKPTNFVWKTCCNDVQLDFKLCWILLWFCYLAITLVFEVFIKKGLMTVKKLSYIFQFQICGYCISISFFVVTEDLRLESSAYWHSLYFTGFTIKWSLSAGSVQIHHWMTVVKKILIKTCLNKYKRYPTEI